VINMRNFYEIETAWGEDLFSLIIEPTNPSMNHLDVYKGLCGTTYLSNFKLVKFKDGHIPDMLPNNMGWPIFSPRCCARFIDAGAGADILFHPLKTILPASFPVELHEYNLLSAKQAIDCIDLDSDKANWFDEAKEFISSYQRLDLVSSKIPNGLHFFGVRRASIVHVISGDVKKMLELDQPDGVAFRACFLT